MSNKIKLNATHSKRPGIHAKTKTAKNPGNKNYKKVYRGQGR